MSKKLLIMAVLVVFMNKTYASDFEWSSQIQSAYTEISAMKLENGRAFLRLNSKEKNGFVPYLESFADMIEMGILENKEKYEVFIQNETRRINFLETLDKNSPFRDFLIAEIHLHTSFIKL